MSDHNCGSVSATLAADALSSLALQGAQQGGPAGGDPGASYGAAPGGGGATGAGPKIEEVD